MPRMTPFAERDWESCTNDAEVPGLAEVVVENVRVEGAGEQAAVVAERLRDEDENVCEVRFFDAHRVMLP